MPAQGVHPQCNQIAREELRQRRGHSFEQRPVLHQIDIGIDRVAYSREHFPAAHNALSGQTQGLGQADPALDSTLEIVVAVVIEHTLAPRPAKTRVIAARKDNRILDRDAALVIVAIENPALQLSPSEFALMHQKMKRVLMVITFLSNLLQSCPKCLDGERVLCLWIYNSR